MTKYIFEEIINTENIFVVIDQHFEDEGERQHVKDLVRSTLHHQLVDMILDELTHEQKTTFLLEITDEVKHQGLLARLREWVENLEEKLHLRTKESESEMLRMVIEQ